MPNLTIVNISGSALPLALRDFYISLIAGQSTTVYRSWGEVTALQNLQVLYKTGQVSIQFTATPEELTFPFLSAPGSYDIAGGVVGRPDGAGLLVQFPAPRAFSLPAGLAHSKAVVQIAPAAIAVFSLQKNGVLFGTITFAIGAFVGVFASAAEAIFLEGNVLTVLAPNPQDALLSDMGLVLAGVRLLL